MNIMHKFSVLLLCHAVTALAGESTTTAIGRTNADNYKDRALAYCIAQAYKGSAPGEDAHNTMSIFLDWTYYDLEKGDQAVDKLVEKYLRRDYSNPFEGYVGAKFNLLKCLDMYHSHELQEQVKRYVPHPDWIANKPAKPRPK